MPSSLLHSLSPPKSSAAPCSAASFDIALVVQSAPAGKGHPIWVLTVSYPGGGTKQFSLRPKQKPVVEQWLRNYRNLKASLERICEINLELLRAEKKK